MDHPIILYDGICGLCNRLVQFILKRDRTDRFRFAALQSRFGREILQRHGLNPDSLDTVYLVLDHDGPDERLLSRNSAIAAVLKELGAGWRILGTAMALLHSSIATWGYKLIACNRYRIFGRYNSCPIPGPNVRHKFLDLM